MEELEFSALLDELQQGQAIIIMGPEAHLLDRFPEDDLPSHFDIIIRESAALQANKSFNLKDGFFLCNSTSKDKPLIFQSIKAYYKNLQAPAFYKWLAALPFNMMISLSPDNLMEQVMRDLDYDYDFAFYKKNSSGLYMRKSYTNNALNDFTQVADLDQLPVASRPLLFNMLGYYEYSDSLLFTYEALFEFLYSNFPVERIPTRLRSAICNASSYIFVGFGYHQWYLKIFFFMLEKIITAGVKKLSGKAIFNYGDSFAETIGVYEKVFPLSFYKDATSAFSQNLYSGLKKSGFSKQPRPGGPFRILYVASLPDGKMPLRQSKEWKEIKAEMAVAEATGKVEFKELFCASINELLLALNKHNPDLLLLSMHGKPEGLFFEDAAGETDVVDVKLLVENLEASKLNPGYRLKCIFLGACHSSSVAEPLSKIVDYCIGFNGAVYDEAVSLFSRGFFSNLVERFSVDGSIATGKQFLSNNQAFKTAVQQVVSYGRDLVPAATRINEAGVGAVGK